MAVRADILEERDVDGEASDLPQVGSTVELPPLPVRSAPVRVPSPEPEFQIVDTDENFQPIGTEPHQRQTPEPSLTEDNPADQPLLDRQRQGETARERTDRADRRARQRQGRDRTLQENAVLRAEVEELRARVSGIEPRLTEFDRSRVQDQLLQLDREIDGAAQRAASAYRRMSEAMVAQDAEAFGSALAERDKAIMDGQQISSRKSSIESGVGPIDNRRGVPEPQFRQAPQIQQPAAPLPAAARAYVQDFVEQNPWYNPDARRADGKPADFDTRIILEIDTDLAAEGFNPSTQDYWDELYDRGARALPHRFVESQAPVQRQPARQVQPRQVQTDPMRRGPAAGGGQDRAPSGGNANQLYLSPARKEAMIAAGVLNRDGRTVEDPVKFRRLAAKYMEFDGANGVARR